jgi:hypothetical protein
MVMVVLTPGQYSRIDQTILCKLTIVKTKDVYISDQVLIRLAPVGWVESPHGVVSLLMPVSIIEYAGVRITVSKII